MPARFIFILPVKVPEMPEVRTVHHQVITVEELHRITCNTGPVARNIQNNFIFGMQVEKAALVIHPCGPES